MESDTRPISKTKTNDRKYGGADKICDVRAEKDMLLIMVGRNTGRDAKETLIERKMNACSHGTTLVRVLNVAEDFRRDTELTRVADLFSSRSDGVSC